MRLIDADKLDYEGGDWNVTENSIRRAETFDIERHDGEVRRKVLDELSNKVMERLNNNRNAINLSNVDSEIFGKICAYDNVMEFVQELKERE